MSLTVEEAFYQRTISDNAIYALISMRLYPGDVPQETELPAMSYQQTDYEQWLTHSGPSGIAQTIIAVTIAAYEYATLKDVREALRECWAGYAGTIGDTLASLRIGVARVENQQDVPIDKIENALGMTVEIRIIYYE
jgi:hypothetical protein